ncbi:MAG: hypothetical protein HQ517_11500 [SAR324 cluster bacterium]|nr:hypothetical protein [SAR324 cluster bacterium]
MKDSAKVLKEIKIATFIGFLGVLIPLILFSFLAIYVKKGLDLYEYLSTGKYVLSVIAYLATNIMIQFTNPDRSAITDNMKWMMSSILFLVILSVLYSISDLRLLVGEAALDLRYWLLHVISIISIWISYKLSFINYQGLYFERVNTPNARELQIPELEKLSLELGVEDDQA